MYWFLLASLLLPFVSTARTLVIGDLHGDGEVLRAILHELQTPDRSPVGPWHPASDELVLTGDLFDRYDKLHPLLETVDGMAENNPGHVHMVAGNHDVMALAGLCGDEQQVANWLGVIHDDTDPERPIHHDNGAGPGIDELAETCSFEPNLRSFLEDIRVFDKYKNFEAYGASNLATVRTMLLNRYRNLASKSGKSLNPFKVFSQSTIAQVSDGTLYVHGGFTASAIAQLRKAMGGKPTPQGFAAELDRLNRSWQDYLSCCDEKTSSPEKDATMKCAQPADQRALVDELTWASDDAERSDHALDTSETAKRFFSETGVHTILRGHDRVHTQKVLPLGNWIGPTDAFSEEDVLIVHDDLGLSQGYGNTLTRLGYVLVEDDGTLTLRRPNGTVEKIGRTRAGTAPR